MAVVPCTNCYAKISCGNGNNCYSAMMRRYASRENIRRNNMHSSRDEPRRYPVFGLLIHHGRFLCAAQSSFAYCLRAHVDTPPGTGRKNYCAVGATIDKSAVTLELTAGLISLFINRIPRVWVLVFIVTIDQGRGSITTTHPPGHILEMALYALGVCDKDTFR